MGSSISSIMSYNPFSSSVGNLEITKAIEQTTNVATTVGLSKDVEIVSESTNLVTSMESSKDSTTETTSSITSSEPSKNSSSTEKTNDYVIVDHDVDDITSVNSTMILDK